MPLNTLNEALSCGRESLDMIIMIPVTGGYPISCPKLSTKGLGSKGVQAYNPQMEVTGGAPWWS